MSQVYPPLYLCDFEVAFLKELIGSLASVPIEHALGAGYLRQRVMDLQPESPTPPPSDAPEA